VTVFILKLIAAYLLGSISGSLLLGRFRQVDIRTLGSGNAGGTNAFRTQGFVFALGVVLIDVGKAVLATAVLPGPAGAGFAGMEITTLGCGFAAVLGHCYPVYHGFQGGKGAATAAGSLMVIQPWLLVPMLLSWLLVLVVTGYVGLATVIAGFSLVPAALVIGASNPLLVFVVAVALFMTFTHRENLARLKQGTESRFEKVRFTNWFGRGSKSGADD
jgi:glycerol-3-phosphate acyltransferase PlsY